MSESYTVTLSNDEWTNISQDNIVGFISNNGSARIHLIQADSQPSDTVLATDGHPLEASAGINFALIQNETVWGRSIQDDAELIVTPGI
jgi:hypothetical protein